MSVLDTLVTNRTSGAKYGFADMNRVADAIEYLANWLQALGVEVAVAPQRFTREDFPTVSVLDYFIGQITALRTAAQNHMGYAPATPKVGSAQPYMTVADANNIEQILLAIRGAAVRLEGLRSWQLILDYLSSDIPTSDSDLYAFYTTEVEPKISYYLDEDCNLYAVCADDIPEPAFLMDDLGNLYLKYLEGD